MCVHCACKDHWLRYCTSILNLLRVKTLWALFHRWKLPKNNPFSSLPFPLSSHFISWPVRRAPKITSQDTGERQGERQLGPCRQGHTELCFKALWKGPHAEFCSIPSVCQCAFTDNSAKTNTWQEHALKVRKNNNRSVCVSIWENTNTHCFNVFVLILKILGTETIFLICTELETAFLQLFPLSDFYRSPAILSKERPVDLLPNVTCLDESLTATGGHWSPCSQRHIFH